MGSGRTFIRSGLVVAIMVAMAGCGDAEGPVDPGSEPGGGTPVGTPAAPGDPLLQVDEAGGFSYPGHDFATVPAVTVYADGRAITHGPQIQIWPPPALPNLQATQLGDADLQAVLDAAVAAGLVGEVPDYGWPIIEDAPTTTVTISVDGQRYVHAANALGYGEEGALPGGDTSLDAIGLTEEQVQARVALLEFIAAAQEIVGSADGGDFYEITAFGIKAWPAVDLGGRLDGQDLDIDVLPWPLDLALDTVQTCELVDGADAQVLLETLTDANTMAQYTQDDVIYQVFFRPLLPHESDCDGLG